MHPIARILSSALLVTALALWSAGAWAQNDSATKLEQTRETIDGYASELIERAMAANPGLEEQLRTSAGWFASRISSAQVAVLGGGFGSGVAVDNRNESRTYLDIRRLDLGAGLGASAYGILLVFNTNEAFDAFRGGSWNYGFSGQSSAGTSGSNVGTGAVDGADPVVYFFSEGGATLQVTARILRIKVNYELTDTAVSSASIPNTGFDQPGQSPDEAPREWGRRFPLLAQKVIDEGYDLPLPYGIGLTYSYVDQEQLISDLVVSLNGTQPEPYDFVSFDNVFSQSSTASLKYDFWLFPFMNLYGMLGHVDGDAPLEVILDGNGMLDQIGTDCSGIITPPLCKLLQDKEFLLPIAANFSGTLYGAGLTLAGGWNGWFVTIPFNWSYADMDTTKTDGVSTTVTPRFGRLFNLDRYGTLAVMVGGNYLDTGLEITGQVALPEDLLVIDYQITQQNKDGWNGVVGFNWDFNRKISWSMEYNGFFGSRDAFITSLVWRY